MQVYCVPVILLTWMQTDLASELNKMGVEVHVLPSLETSNAYKDIRRRIDLYFRMHLLKSPLYKIQLVYLQQYQPLKARWLRQMRTLYNSFKFYMPYSEKGLFSREKVLLENDKSYAYYRDFILSINIDAVFTLTPFHRQEDILLRICHQMGKKMIASILSFDNITKRGWIPVPYDTYMVWNKANKEQLHRIYPFTRDRKVIVTGPAQFDFYFQKEYLLSKEEWKKRLGIADRTRVILYAGGPAVLFPNEPQYLCHLLEFIAGKKIEGNPVILFRCHPYDRIERWVESVGSSYHLVFDNSWKGEKNIHQANITDEDIKQLCSTLAYTDVHINLCSTMTLDGSMFDKPQIGPAYDEIRPKTQHLLRKMYEQEHFLPILDSGGLQLAYSRKQMAELINEALKYPKKYSSQRKKMLDQLITYVDGKCTMRVNGILKNELGHGIVANDTIEAND